MPDNRFPEIGVDARFPEPDVDVEYGGAQLIATLRNGNPVFGSVRPGDELTARFPVGGTSQAAMVAWLYNGSALTSAMSATVPLGAEAGDTVSWTAVDGAGDTVSGRSHVVFPAPVAPTLSALSLSSATVAENAAPGTTIGAIQGETAGSTVTLVGTAGGRFALSGGNLVRGLAALDYESATSHEITLRETLVGATNTPRNTTLTITVTDVDETASEPFSVTLASDGTLEIDGNDGRDFTVDDDADRYDGTYSADPADLANGPVALKAPVLAGDGSAVPGETLTIIPALFAYDSDLGDVTVTYTTTGANDVDDTDPDNPTLLIDAADAESTITVTATATQDGNSTDSVSNGVSIAAAPSASVTASYVGSFEASTLDATSGSGNMDLSGANAGDRLVIMYGTASVTEPSLTVAGNAVPASIVDTSDGAFGGKNFVFEYVLDGTETASTPVAFSGADAGNRHFVAVALVKGGTRDDAGIEFQGQVDTVAVSVTPASTENVIVAFVMGRESYLGAGRSWTNATEDTLETNGPNDRAVAVAFATDVPASAYTVSFDPDPGANTSDEVSLAVLAYSA